MYLLIETLYGLHKHKMTELFKVDRTVITRHVNNVFKEKELIKESNVQKMHIWRRCISIDRREGSQSYLIYD